MTQMYWDVSQTLPIILIYLLMDLCSCRNRTEATTDTCSWLGQGLLTVGLCCFEAHIISLKSRWHFTHIVFYKASIVRICRCGLVYLQFISLQVLLYV